MTKGKKEKRQKGEEAKRSILFAFLPLYLFTFCLVIGCRGESSISKLEEQLETEKKKREEESKKYVEVLNRLYEEKKRSEEQEKLIADLRHEQKASQRVGELRVSESASQDPKPETQNSKLKTQMDKLIQIADRFYWDGDYAVAKEIYDVAAELGNPKVDTLFRLAKCYGVTPETDKAISLYKKVIASLEHNDEANPVRNSSAADEPLLGKQPTKKEISNGANPLHYQAYNNLGGMYKKKDMYKEAELAYVKAIELNEEYTNAYYNLGLLYEENLDDELGAIACYEKYIELDGERSEYIKKKLEEIKAKD